VYISEVYPVRLHSERQTLPESWQHITHYMNTKADVHPCFYPDRRLFNKINRESGSYQISTELHDDVTITDKGGEMSVPTVILFYLNCHELKFNFRSLANENSV
jgi:hypothetical protein